MIYVAFLRAINVGGKGIVKMTDVRAAFERAGCRNARTFIASGNVVFDAPRMTKPLMARISREMTTLLGSAPGICYRTIEELETLIAAGPFARLTGDKALKLYVAFMNGAPATAPKLPLTDPKELVEITSIRGCDALIVSRRKPNGMYGFPTFCVERMGVTATCRNWNTVVRVAAFARS